MIIQNSEAATKIPYSFREMLADADGSSLPAAAGAAAEDAEFGAMRVVERDPPECACQGRAEVEARVVGQERASDDARPRCPLKFDHHARAGAHDVLGRFAKDAPACLGDLRHVGGGIH